MSDSPSEKRDSRERIIVAAATMISENPAARLSVRAVAAEAGVSTGSLRHHFPTQRALQDAVLDRIYDVVAPGDPIHDTSVPARDRLVRCLRQVLEPGGTGERARGAWAKAYRAFIESPTNESRSAYLALEREMRHRVEHWLSVLADEGELPAGDHTARARFLLTVLNGISIERALPSETSTLASETTTLHAAAESVLKCATSREFGGSSLGT